MHYRSGCSLCLIFLFNTHVYLTALVHPFFHHTLEHNMPPWMLEQINHDLEPFHEQLCSDFLDEIFEAIKDPWYLVRMRITNSHLTFETSNTSKNYELIFPILNTLQNLHHTIPLPDLDMIMTCHDGYDYNRDGTVTVKGKVFPITAMPIFAIAKRKEDPGMILMPDWYACEDFYPNKTQILKGNQKYKWESKIPRVFFRGANSGLLDGVDWRNLPRVKLVDLSLKRPDLVDARFPYLLHRGDDSDMQNIMAKEGMMGDYVPIKDSLKYRYLIDIDGFTANTPRVALFLHSNSVLFKQLSNDMLWYFGALKPYVHLIPVEKDLSDLIDKIEWARTHDDECKKISNNANDLASQALTQGAVYFYFYRLLEAYAKKQQAAYFK
jgi:hypothetical protein